MIIDLNSVPGEGISPVVRLYLETVTKLSAIDADEAREEIARIITHLETLGVVVKGYNSHTEDYGTLMPEVTT